MNAKIDISKVVLETSRLILRPWNINDLNDFYEYASVEGVGEMAGWPHHKHIDTSKNILNSFILGKKTFAIVLKTNNKVIGSLGIEEDSLNHECCNKLYGRELGYVLSKDYWGQGIMTEAVKEVIRYLFLELELDYIVGGHFTHNSKSKRVIEKNGFVYVLSSPYKTAFDTIEESNYYLLMKNDYLKRIEKIQLYDEKCNPVDNWVYRGAKLPDGYLRGVVDIVIKNTKYDKYLLTRRDRNKETYPNLLETTGGSVSYGEDINTAAKRELKEETGIEYARITFLYKIILDARPVVFFEFYAETECELDSIKLQPGETTEYVWLDKNEYLNIWDSKLVVGSQKKRIQKVLESIR